MYFRHADEIWADYAELAAGTLVVGGVDTDGSAGPRLAKYIAVAEERLAAGPESELPEIQAWRRAFARMGLKPTRYRCASEALLRRFRKEGDLPVLHPLVDLCNAVSLAFAIPVAVFDTARITGGMEVRYASGREEYTTFAGEVEHPDVGEVVFADEAGRAHARRWTNRQSGHSAVRDGTASALVVAEALHGEAAEHVAQLVEVLAGELAAVWSVGPGPRLLSRRSPQLDF